jgi:hypothetical protein
MLGDDLSRVPSLRLAPHTRLVFSDARGSSGWFSWARSSGDVSAHVRVAGAHLPLQARPVHLPHPVHHMHGNERRPGDGFLYAAQLLPRPGP